MQLLFLWRALREKRYFVCGLVSLSFLPLESAVGVGSVVAVCYLGQICYARPVGGGGRRLERVFVIGKSDGGRWEGYVSRKVCFVRDENWDGWCLVDFAGVGGVQRDGQLQVREFWSPCAVEGACVYVDVKFLLWRDGMVSGMLGVA